MDTVGSKNGGVDPLLISRKDFVRVGGLGAAALVLGLGVSTDPVLARPRFSSYPFTLGVASGDPLANGVVIWTRLAPIEGGLPNRGIRVRYRVAEDEAMRRVVKSGTTTATPELGHSVHVDVRGLKPNREYHYQFEAGGATSPIGRTKTTPALGAATASLLFAFTSCQDYENGFYAAYRAMVEEAEAGVRDLDLVVHLGDYIYEGGPQGPIRQHTDPPKEIMTLSDYRDRHALYRRDMDLQEAHRIFPFIVTWDDHETDNNYADEIPEDDQGRREFLRRRAAAYQAYYENMPLRRTSLPKGPDLLLYRRLAYGDLAEFSVLDTRQYRTDQPCGDGLKERCPEALSESQTMTGPKQERWLLDGLDRSGALWNVIAQQTMLAEFDFNAAPGRGANRELFNMDQWDGYVAARNRLLGFLNRNRGVSNPITLTGDIHSSWVHDLKTDFANPASRTVGAEFVGTSISSSFPSAFLAPVQAALTDNPHTKFFDGANRGYVVCDVNRKRWKTTFRGVVTEPGNGTVSSRLNPDFDLATFVVENGQPGATQQGPTNNQSPPYTGPSAPFNPARIN